MKKYCLILLVALGFSGCSYGEDAVLGVLDEERLDVIEKTDLSEKILIIVGEGGPSGSMFSRSAITSQKEQGGEIYEVHSGDEFVAAFNDFLEKKGEIDHLEYFGHGNHVGLYVNQAPNVNGGLYVNDLDLNKDYIAASIYEVDRGAFTEYGWIKLNGCNVAKDYPGGDNLAQRMANYFDADVVAPMGPTEFSKKSYTVDPIENSNYLSPDFDGDVYMVPTYPEEGFVLVEPQEVGETGYDDVRLGQSFYEAVEGLLGRGLVLGPSDGQFFPYKNATYGEAVHLCEVAFGEKARCYLPGYEKDDKIRNLRALKMLVDTYGVELKYTSPWYDSYIWWAKQNDLLTKDFTDKKWYTRGEMAELTWNFVVKFSL